MEHTEELSAAMDAAEEKLLDLDLTSLLLIAEVGDYGIQIVLSDRTDPITVRYALRGAANALEGKITPVIDEVMAALYARGWKSEDGWSHKELPGRKWMSVTEALVAQTGLEVQREVRVESYKEGQA